MKSKESQSSRIKSRFSSAGLIQSYGNHSAHLLTRAMLRSARAMQGARGLIR